MQKKMTMTKWEKSAADKKMDAKPGAPKEGSAADRKADLAGMKKAMMKGAKGKGK